MGSGSGCLCSYIEKRVGLTIRLKVEAAEGFLDITGVDFPAELVAGAVITGSISFINTGEADTFAVILHTGWDDRYYGTTFNLGRGGGGTITFREADSPLIMPNQDAHITVYGCHAQPGGEFLIDSTEFKIDDTVEH